MIGTTHFLSWSKGIHPYYQLNNQGQLVRNGSFRSAQPFRVWLIKKLSKISIFNFFNLNYPDPYSDKNFRVVCQTFYKIKELVSQQLPNGHFVIVLGIYNQNRKNKDKIIQCLSAGKISFVDMEPFHSKAPKKVSIHRLESHLSRESNEYYAKALKELLAGY